MSHLIELVSAPDDTLVDLVRRGLSEFNVSQVGLSGRHDLAVVVRSSPGGEVAGGLIGYTAWGWLHIERLWLPDALRGMGLGSAFLREAEQEAERRGCTGAWLDTFNPEALRLYQRFGYAVFGSLADFPTGRSRHFLHKRLTPTPSIR